LIYLPSFDLQPTQIKPTVDGSEIGRENPPGMYKKTFKNDYDKLDKLPFPQLVSESRISEPSNCISDN